ncbi:MAG: glycosyl hydrolase 115 family protein [Bacteroidia bacterium]
MKKLLLLLLIFPCLAYAQIQVTSQVSNKKQYFPIVEGDATASILYDASDYVLIQKSAGFLASDIEKVTGKKPSISTSKEQANGPVIIIGTIGKSALIDQLIANRKLKVDAIRGQWERFIIQTVKSPFPGIKEALVIAGSDKRGAAYGVFTISKEMGVSPWYWWADVPVKKSKELFIKKERYVSNSPSVKYRGIFLNDEAPALRNWAEETFGGFNHQFYEKIFELILRNKANYLWPAMWRPAVFATDDPENARIADEYGIVISTTHHEPMMRYHEEWSRYDAGAWNYQTNKENLRKFWKEGIERMGDRESVVTLGMRGDGDEAMSEETAVGLMKTIIEDQRQIIEEVTEKPAKETPQVWAIYKEVQDYYDKGMRVDDDILVLFCDDNWGNVRILPKKEDLGHSGGYGMYYHFDFVGGPVSYRWINVTQIERVWEQMNLSYQWGVKDLWIVNVGDLKPMELPISFFLDFAWDTDAIRAKDLPNYYENWAEQQFGKEYAQEIAEILALYTKYSARRTPEMLKPDTYSLSNYREADRILEEYKELLNKSNDIYKKLPQSYKAAYYQLAHFPIEIAANLNEMYVSAGKNTLYGLQSRASTNFYADKVRETFFRDAELTRYYHEKLADGKWNHIMSQTHIGYTSWNNPPVNKMPEVSYIQAPSSAGLGYVVEHGASSRWTRGGLFSRSFSTFDPVNDQTYYLEIFNRGNEKLDYSVSSKNDWIKLSVQKGSVQFEEKIMVSINWEKAPKGQVDGEIMISGAGQEFIIKVPINNNLFQVSGFVENNGIISIEAPHFTQKFDSESISWTTVPNLGRTNSSMTVEPANAARQMPGTNSPRLEYTFTLFSEGDLNIETYLSPTLNYQKNEGLKYAIAIDDETPQIINIHEGDEKPDWEYPEWWNNSVTDHIRKRQSVHKSIKPGVHTLKVWMVDPGVVFQKFVIDAGGVQPSYLGPPESVYVK